MKAIIILLAIGLVAFLLKVGFLFYEVLRMDFDFNRPWPNDITSTKQMKKPKIPVLSDAHQVENIEVLTKELITR